MTVLRARRQSNSAKMGLAMKRRFWEEDDQIFGGYLYSNLPKSASFVSFDRILFSQGRAGPVLRTVKWAT
jgi:monoamine oxidase